ncbi:MAG: polyribonucleotide nucleotidyltransferase [Candidatus Dojkabacteria bacterium]
MQSKITHEFDLNGVQLKLETGEIANLAQSAFLVTYGESCVLVAVTVGDVNPDLDFFPLTVDYVEKLYAAGDISSSPYIKREGRPTDSDILHARLIDHAIRSLFPPDFRNEVHVVAQIMSYDNEHDPAIAALIGVSFALSYSGLPFLGPYGLTLIGYNGEKLLINPTLQQQKESKLELFVSSVKEGITSLESEAHDLDKELVKQAITLALEQNNKLIAEQEAFIQKYEKKEFTSPVKDDRRKALFDEVQGDLTPKLEQVIYIVEKSEREQHMKELKAQLLEAYDEQIQSEEYTENDVIAVFEKVAKTIVRRNILKSDKRPDGRDLKTVRDLSARVGVLPRTHGSALFSRGETQSLTTVTLGTERDAQMLQDLSGEYSKSYFHHYNMPGYANGEVDRRLGFANRRAIGHGAIGEKALKNMIPVGEDFPYTIRVVSEITSSNGSTSMAATCGSTLALMDAGVELKKIIGGVGVGLVYEDESNYRILTDIIGMEDFYGDMDFKITGSRDGVTAIQLDNKMSGIPSHIIFEAIDQSHTARQVVIDAMEACIPGSRGSISKYAPRVHTLHVPQDKIGEVIGPGGKVIKSIIEKTGVEINIEDDGRVMIYSGDNPAGVEEAIGIISSIAGDMNINQEYDVQVVRVESYGIFVEIPYTRVQGMIHVSNLNLGYVKDLKEKVNVGDKMKVLYKGKDEKGRIKFMPVQEKI